MLTGASLNNHERCGNCNKKHHQRNTTTKAAYLRVRSIETMRDLEINQLNTWTFLQVMNTYASFFRYRILQDE